MNPAAFFVQRYMPVDGYIKRPLEKLILIAAHTVLMASKLNPTGITGLDIALCRHGRAFEMLSPEEIAEVTAESKKIDSQISAGLGIT